MKMINKVKSAIVLSLALSSLTSCSAWIEFDMKRYAFSFVITLVIGVVGLIIMAIKGGNRNDKN